MEWQSPCITMHINVVIVLSMFNYQLYVMNPGVQTFYSKKEYISKNKTQ
jgi:hypothetical protein